jgi:hypothetical protein
MPIIFVLVAMILGTGAGIGVLLNNKGKWWVVLSILLIAIGLSSASWLVVAGNAPWPLESVENCRIITLEDSAEFSSTGACQVARSGKTLYNVTQIMGIFYDPKIPYVLRVHRFSNKVKGIDFMRPIDPVYTVVLDTPEAQ